MKEIGQIRAALERIRALPNPEPSHRPRYRGGVIASERADLGRFQDAADAISTEHPRSRDLRNPEALFNELDNAVAATGIDALAWYHPFHLSGDEWGIYVPGTSVHYCAERWFSPRIRRSRRLQLAIDALLAHEVMHFACEYAVAQFELLLAAPCWAPARLRLRQAKLEWFDDEEALANANCVRSFSGRVAPAVSNRLKEHLLRAPQGYRDFPAALSDDGFQDHLLEVLRHNVGITAIDLKAGFLETAFDAVALYPQIDTALADCPLYLIDDGGHFDLPPLAPRIITRIERIEESSRFTRMLRKYGRAGEWADKKRQLQERVPRHPHFEKLGGNLQGNFSVRLSDGYRAHLRPGPHGQWIAVEIGPHGKMGHG